MVSASNIAAANVDCRSPSCERWLDWTVSSRRHLRRQTQASQRPASRRLLSFRSSVSEPMTRRPASRPAPRMLLAASQLQLLQPATPSLCANSSRSVGVVTRHYPHPYTVCLCKINIKTVQSFSFHSWVCILATLHISHRS